MLVFANAEKMAIEFLNSKLSELIGVDEDFLDVRAELPASIDQAKPGQWPKVTLRKTGARTRRVSINCVSPFETVDFTVNVWGNKPKEEPNSALIDPCTGNTFVSPREEVQYLAQLVKACLMHVEQEPFAADTGIILCGFVDSDKWLPSEPKDRARYVLDIGLQIRNTGKCLQPKKPRKPQPA